MEIRLDGIAAKMYVEKMKEGLGGLLLGGTSSEISGKSEALEKFMESYGEFETVINKYELVLSKDIQSVLNIISTWMEKDQILSGQIKGTEKYTGLPEIPKYKYKEVK